MNVFYFPSFPTLSNTPSFGTFRKSQMKKWKGTGKDNYRTIQISFLQRELINKT